MSGCVVFPWSKPADKTGPLLSRVWVIVVPYCASCSLMALVIDSSGSEQPWCLTMFHVHWWLWFSALQLVSGCLLCFKTTDDACPGSFREWVTTSDLLSLKPTDYACPCLSLTLQHVSGCNVLPTDHAYTWLLSLWVAAVPCCVSSLLMTTLSCFSGSEWFLFCISIILMKPVISLQSVSS